MAKYDFLASEKKWQEFWRDQDIYKFDPSSSNPVFSIDTPPPTVSGKLHMGHVFSYTQTEIIARYKRMAGFNVYYPFGMDDNGLPTERLVEQELGIKGSEMNRDDFINKCLSVVGDYHKKYRDLWQSLGLSVDWNLEYSTISESVRRLTQQNFIQLFNSGHIYRKKSPSLWCWNCQTSVAQAEVEDSSKDSVFYDIVFKDDSGNDLIIATTRPELLPACVGIIVNPQDKRYQKLIGHQVTTPLGDSVEVFADEKAKIDKGTGVVMCCTYGDETDLEWKNKFNLDEKIIIDKHGKIDGQSITESRAKIVSLLREKDCLKKELPIVHDVGCHERCGVPIEIINTDQWFVKVLDSKKELLDLGNQINWYPKSIKVRYDSWVENLKWDWCISRDRFYGISVPVYFCEDCGEVVLPDEQDLPLDPISTKLNKSCSKCGSANLRGENLVLDTWFTSGNTPELNVLLNPDLTGGKITVPMSLRPQAHDIIRTWAFYTIVLAHYKYNAIPWTDIAISGHILLRKGEKISKRTGGGQLRPEEQISTHSADAIRFAMCGASLGVDAYYDDNEIENGKKLINKIYNASNFCIMALADYQHQSLDIDSLEPIDQWLLAQSFSVAKDMGKFLDKYDYSHSRDIFTTFFWSTFCDHYLEVIKKRIYDLTPDNASKRSAQTALFYGLLNILKMASPFVPHITEEIYQGYFKNILPSALPSIHINSWPVEVDTKIKKIIDSHDKVVTEILNLISLVRGQKSHDGVSLAKEVEVLKILHPSLTLSDLEPFLFDIRGTTRAKNISITTATEVSVNLTYATN
jgi:valyl-tRNA synthetase